MSHSWLLSLLFTLRTSRRSQSTSRPTTRWSWWRRTCVSKAGTGAPPSFQVTCGLLACFTPCGGGGDIPRLFAWDWSGRRQNGKIASQRKKNMAFSCGCCLSFVVMTVRLAFNAHVQWWRYCPNTSPGAERRRQEVEELFVFPSGLKIWLLP